MCKVNIKVFLTSEGCDDVDLTRAVCDGGNELRDFITTGYFLFLMNLLGTEGSEMKLC